MRLEPVHELRGPRAGDRVLCARACRHRRSIAISMPRTSVGCAKASLPRACASSTTAFAMSASIGRTSAGPPTIAPVNSFTPSAPPASWRPRAIARLLSRRHFGARPAILLVQLANVDRRAVLRIERRVHGQQQRAAKLAALDPLAQRQLLPGTPAMSNAAVKPQRVSIRCSAASRIAAGLDAASRRSGTIRCTWLFQNPATTVLPVAVDHGRAGRHGCLACRTDALDAAVAREHRRVRDRRGIGRWIDGGADDGEVASARDRRQPEIAIASVKRSCRGMRAGLRGCGADI